MHRILGPFKNTYVMIHKGKWVRHYCWAAFQFPEGTKFEASTVVEIPMGFMFCKTASFGADVTLHEAKTSVINSLLTDHFDRLSDRELDELRAMKWRTMTKRERMRFRFRDDPEIGNIYEPGRHIVTGGAPFGANPLYDISEATASQDVPEADRRRNQICWRP